MEQSDKRRVAEALILGSGEPISGQRIAEIIPYCKPKHVKGLVDELNADYIKSGRAFEIVEVAGGYQMRTLPEFAPYLTQTLKTRALRLSQAALETLAVVAYRQPVTRGEIEHIRGVDAGAVVRSLIERKLVRIAGHRDVPGKPMLYGTTRRFLEVFELQALDELPTLRDLKELAPEGALAGEDAPAEQLAAAVAGAGEDAAPSGESEASEVEAPAAESDDGNPEAAGETAASVAAGEEPAAAANAEDAPPVSAAEGKESTASSAAPAEPVPNDPSRPFAVAGAE
jgi:segregation and condensation protein B